MVASGRKEEGEGGGGGRTGKLNKRENDSRTRQDGGEGLEESREKTHEEASNWDRVVELVKTAFRKGHLAEESTCQAVVLIHKGEKEYHAIGCVEVMWKVVEEI